MKISSSGYTLIELLMAVSLLVLVLVGGTTIFYRSFRSSGVSDIKASLNTSLRTLDEMIERSLRFGEVIRVGDNYFREECLMASPSEGIVGSELVVRDPAGSIATYSLIDGEVSSNSGVIISNPEIEVTKLQFTWYCRSGVNDKINLLIEARSRTNSGEGSEASFVKDINLLNSGIN